MVGAIVVQKRKLSFVSDSTASIKFIIVYNRVRRKCYYIIGMFHFTLVFDDLNSCTLTAYIHKTYCPLAKWQADTIKPSKGDGLSRGVSHITVL